MSICRYPGDRECHERLSLALDALLRTRMPDGKADQLLKGRDADIRQSAHLLLLQRYLAGNSLLMDATARQDMDEIINQLERSTNAALSAATRQMLRMVQREHRLHEYYESLDEVPYASCVHPTQHLHRWELPFEAQRQLVFLALESALRGKLLPAQNIKMVCEMIDGEMTQAEMARHMNISRSAVSQRLGAIRKILQVEIERTEFPGEEK